LPSSALDAPVYGRLRRFVNAQEGRGPLRPPLPGC